MVEHGKPAHGRAGGIHPARAARQDNLIGTGTDQALDDGAWYELLATDGA